MSAKTRPCEVCGKMIDAERAESLPETRLCTEHGEAIAKFGGEFIRSSSMDRTSKEGSLKKNYGGVTTQKRRNQAAIEKLKDEYDREQWEKKKKPQG